MSRDFMEDYLQHSWGKSPQQKKREKEYNRQYYLNNKERWTRRNATQIYRQAQNAEDKSVDEAWKSWDTAVQLDRLARDETRSDMMRKIARSAHDRYFEAANDWSQRMDVNATKANERIEARRAYEKTLAGKIEKMVNIAHDDALVTVKKGLEFVKNLFK